MSLWDRLRRYFDPFPVLCENVRRLFDGPLRLFANEFGGEVDSVVDVPTVVNALHLPSLDVYFSHDLRDSTLYVFLAVPGSVTPDKFSYPPYDCRVTIYPMNEGIAEAIGQTSIDPLLAREIDYGDDQNLLNCLNASLNCVRRLLAVGVDTRTLLRTYNDAALLSKAIDEQYIRALVEHALLGNIEPDLQQVGFRLADKAVMIYFVVEGADPATFYDDLEVAVTEVIADLPEDWKVDYQFRPEAPASPEIIWVTVPPK